MKPLTAVLLLCFGVGCSGDLTEIVVVVDSNLPVPSELDAVQVIVTGSETMNATGSLSTLPLPRTVGLVHSGGSTGPITVRAVGSVGGVTVVESIATTSFLEGRTLILPMFLGRNCAMVTCADGLTCIDGSCGSDVVDPNGLADWMGDVPRLDGGPECSPAAEACNGMDDDCDGIIDEDFDFRSDSSNCGRCGASCTGIPNATASCMSSNCVISACDMGFDDCNTSAPDGCEADLGSPANCAACGTVCSFTNATAACAAGACALDTCVSGFGDCNTDTSDGCELDVTTLTDCGTCGNACDSTNATVACTSGACAITMCDAGFGDCNMDTSDACEADLASIATCGICTRACDTTNATVACTAGACEITTCDTGFDDCNTDVTDGCERSIRTVSDCGSCGTGCSVTRGTGECSTGVCLVGSCDTGRGDCDTDPSDCETNTRNDDLHCGMCGNACTGGTRCSSSVCS